MMNKLVSINRLNQMINKFHKKVVLCHGVFDLLHTGHIDHFEEAKKISKAEILIVSITDDNFVNKGINRPINKINDRVKILSSISVIDYIVVNKAITAIELLKNLKPNYYCKGPDYKNFKKDITDNILLEKRTVQKYGGKIIFTNSPTKSSSNLINSHFKNLNKFQEDFIKNLKKDSSVKIKNIFTKFKKLKILIVGEIIIDEYIFCEALGKSGKESVLTFRNLKKEKYLGGSLAVANHLSSFVSKIDVVSYNGKSINSFKKRLPKNVNLRSFKKDKTNTVVKTRYIDHIDNRKFMGIYDINDTILNQKEENLLLSKLKDIKKFDIVIVCDYGHGLVTEKISKYISKNSKFLCVNAQVNSSNLSYHSIRKYKNTDCVVVNGLELRHEKRDRYTDIEKLAKEMRKEIKSKNIAVTQGKNGAFIVNNKGEITNCPAFATKIIDKVGSGDALLATLSIFLQQKNNEKLSLFASSLAAAQSVESIGNSLRLDYLKLLKSITYMLK